MRHLIRLFASLSAVLILSACATSTKIPAEILAINSLESTGEKDGDFKGLEC